jgi:hypothetical protein
LLLRVLSSFPKDEAIISAESKRRLKDLEKRGFLDEKKPERCLTQRLSVLSPISPKSKGGMRGSVFDNQGAMFGKSQSVNYGRVSSLNVSNGPAGFGKTTSLQEYTRNVSTGEDSEPSQLAPHSFGRHRSIDEEESECSDNSLEGPSRILSDRTDTADSFGDSSSASGSAKKSSGKEKASMPQDPGHEARKPPESEATNPSQPPAGLNEQPKLHPSPPTSSLSLGITKGTEPVKIQVWQQQYSQYDAVRQAIPDILKAKYVIARNGKLEPRGGAARPSYRRRVQRKAWDVGETTAVAKARFGAIDFLAKRGQLPSL